MPVNHFQLFDSKPRTMLAVTNMKVRRIVIIEIHRDHNSQEAADFRHGGLPLAGNLREPERLLSPPNRARLSRNAILASDGLNQPAGVRTLPGQGCGEGLIDLAFRPLDGVVAYR